MPLAYIRRRYLDNGIRLYRLHAGKKIPVYRLGDVTYVTDEDDVPTSYNVGFASHRHLVIDVDRHGDIDGFAAYDRLRVEYQLVDHPWHVLTPGRGLHVYYELPTHVVGLPIDRQFTSGYQGIDWLIGRNIAAPPSEIDGRRYEFTGPPTTARIPALPDHLCSVLFRVTASQTQTLQSGHIPSTVPIDLIRRLLDLIDTCQHSMYSDWLAIVAAVHHLTDGSDQGRELAIEWSRRDARYHEDSGVDAKWPTLTGPTGAGYYAGLGVLLRAAERSVGPGNDRLLAIRDSLTAHEVSVALSDETTEPTTAEAIEDMAVGITQDDPANPIIDTIRSAAECDDLDDATRLGIMARCLARCPDEARCVARDAICDAGYEIDDTEYDRVDYVRGAGSWVDRTLASWVYDYYLARGQRLVHRADQWYQYDQTRHHYVLVPDIAAPIVDVADRIIVARPDLRKGIKHSISLARDHVLPALQSLAEWREDYLTTPHYWSYPHGILSMDPATGEVEQMAHTSLVFTDRIYPCDYSREGKPITASPTFCRILNDAAPDVDVRREILEAFGVGLMKRKTIPLIVCLIGPQRCGKTTILRGVLNAVMPGTLVTGSIAQFADDPFGASDLIGKTAYLDEDYEITRRLPVDVIKFLTNADIKSVRRKYEGRINHYIGCTLFLAANAAPQLGGSDGGLDRRLAVFSLGKRSSTTITDLEERLAGECYGLVHLLGASIARLCDRRRNDDPNNYSPSLTGVWPYLRARDDNTEVRETTTVGSWIAQLTSPSPGGRIAIRDCYTSYLAYCADSGVRSPMTVQQLSRDLRAAGEVIRKIGGTSYLLDRILAARRPAEQCLFPDCDTM